MSLIIVAFKLFAVGGLLIDDGFVMKRAEHLVILVVHQKLNWVLVVGEQRIVAVGKIGEGSSEEVSLFDRGSVAVRAEELVSEGQDHKLLHKFVAHHELFGGARNVPVVVHDSHSCETSNLHLESEVVLHVNVNGRLFGTECAG